MEAVWSVNELVWKRREDGSREAGWESMVFQSIEYVQEINWMTSCPFAPFFFLI